VGRTELQVVQADDRAPAHDHRVVDRILELADIAGPAVQKQPGFGAGIELD
jgi:hypothetical protein